MNKRKVIGIMFVAAAVLIAVISFKKVMTKDNETAEPTTTMEETSAVYETTVTAAETTQEVTYETVTIDRYHDEHVNEHEIKIKSPSDDILALVDNDDDGFRKEIMTFVNGYGYGDADMAEFTGDVEMNTTEHLVSLTYYLKWNRKDIKYFYLKYNKKTKEWSSKQA